MAKGEPAPGRAFPPVDAAAGFTLGVLALSSVVLGFYQGAFGQWLLSR